MKQREQARLLLKKALQDEALLNEILSSPSVSDEIFGFHCQQAAEKLLKAALSLHGVEFVRTHNLRFLMDLLTDAGHPLPADFADLDTLTPYGTLFRYEDLPEEIRIDRGTLLRLVKSLRSYVENQDETTE
jgi:HEPN domain-containing protein